VKSVLVKSVRAFVMACLSCLALIGTDARVATADPAIKRILLLHAYGVGRPFRAVFDGVFGEAIRSGEAVPVDLYEETVESERFPTTQQTQLVREYVKNKYADRKIDVIVAAGISALTFARQNRQLFGNPPIVAIASGGQISGRNDDVTGLEETSSYGRTIELALALRPETRSVFVIDGSRYNTGALEAAVEREFKALNSGITLVYLRDVPLSDLLARIRTVPERSVVLFLTQTILDRSRDVDDFEALSQVVSASRVPVFTHNEQFLGRGVLGGYVWRLEPDVKRLAAMAKRIASGASARDIPSDDITITPTLDWQQLQRWHIPQARVPAGSIVLFRPPSFFELYRRYVVGGLLVFTAQFAFIVALLVQRTRRRRAEQAVVRKEADLRTSYDRIRDLAGRLITAQEGERTRIARELHDDACQDVATVALDIHNLLDKPETVNPSARLALSSVHTKLAGIAESLRLLSHDLHPSVLQHIGLVAALEAHCAEAERHYDVQVRFIVEGDVEQTAPPVALSLFRIAQEALRNAARHGRARHATVSLVRCNGDVTLSVADDGVGFDIADAPQNGGLGLVSMEERARLVKGHITIHSQPQKGTTITVRAPLDAMDDPHKQQGFFQSAADLPLPDSPDAQVHGDVGAREAV
jgi:signal transduction histidine kinase